MRILDQAHCIEFGAHVADRRRRALAAAGFARTLFSAAATRASQPASWPIENQSAGWSAISSASFASSSPITCAASKPKALARAVRAVAKAIPDFPLGILFAAEQDGPDSVESSPRHQKHRRFRLAEAGQVLEITVGAIGKLGIPIARHFRRGGNQRDPAASLAHALGQQESALVIR
jgi:hypothetical protein